MDLKAHVILFLVTNVMIFLLWFAWLMESFIIFLLLLIMTALLFEPTALGTSIPAIVLIMYRWRQRDERLVRVNLLLPKASKNGHLKYVKLLISKGATKFNQAMFDAAGNGHAEIVKLFLSLETERDEYPSVILEAAIKNGHLNIVELILLERPFNIGDALLIAVNWGTTDIVKFLVSKGVDVIALNSALSNAVSFANGDAIRILAPILAENKNQNFLIDALSLARNMEDQAIELNDRFQKIERRKIVKYISSLIENKTKLVSA